MSILKNRDEHFMKIAINEAKIAFEEDEIPVGAVIAVSYTHLTLPTNTPV